MSLFLSFHFISQINFLQIGRDDKALFVCLSLFGPFYPCYLALAAEEIHSNFP